jgi:DNA-binding NarL/FixJ family response regulator
MKIVIYEATGDWAVALRRELSPPVVVLETRSADEMFRELSQFPAAVAAVEITESRAESAIASVAKVSRQFPRAAVVALADRGLSRFESIVREAGAAHVVYSTRQAREIAAIAQQHLAGGDQNDFNAEDGSFEQQILARLPWGS